MSKEDKLALFLFCLIAFCAGIFVGKHHFKPESSMQPDEWVLGQVVEHRLYEENRLAIQAHEYRNAALSGKGFGAVAGKNMVYASLSGTTYHRYNCPELDKIPRYYLMWFHTEEAKAREYRPCGICNPPE
ncbi:MAG: hypothetical protein RJR35_09840 [Thermoanaerobacterales bacterium]|nr:hypothetical protein [Thermoanaerobacterales bacterium]MDR9757009.1 hypothetical protein [Thermoanaerobacterales bacterium]